MFEEPSLQPTFRDCSHRTELKIVTVHTNRKLHTTPSAIFCTLSRCGNTSVMADRKQLARDGQAHAEECHCASVPKPLDFFLLGLFRESSAANHSRASPVWSLLTMQKHSAEEVEAKEEDRRQKKIRMLQGSCFMKLSLLLRDCCIGRRCPRFW